MGVVYSGLELQRGAIPRDGAHLEAADMVIDRISSLPWVTTTLVHGSVLDGRSNRRSDLDTLVIYRYEDLRHIPHAVGVVKQILDEVSSETAVKVEANIWPSEEPTRARKQRMYDMLYSWHLRHAMLAGKGLAGEVDQQTLHVADTLPAEDTEAIRDVALNYTVYKQGGFTGAPTRYVDGDPRALAAMQRGLELPKSIGRKVAQLIASCEGREISGNDFVFDIHMLDDPTKSALTKLAQINSDYTELLECYRGMDGNPNDLSDYTAWIEQQYGAVIANGMVATVGLSHFIHDYIS
ncbi:hypothetical protein KC992_00100 [Candidatus Saccharibacteria bacterium]|nr:hypothetical protein [Candidatus Saccharibacteria bacterium]